MPASPAQVEPDDAPSSARLGGFFIARNRETNLNREQKTAAVEEIAGQIEAAESIFAIDYRGISVPQAAELRARLRESDASFRVVKNRLTKLAAEKAGRDQLSALLDGPTALTFVRGDMAAAAKTITTLDRDWEVLEFKGGLVDGEVLEVDEFKAIARLPGRDALNAQLAGVVASPVTGLVRGLGSMLSGLASQLQQMAEQGLVSGEAPAEPEPEAPAEEEAPAEGDVPAEEAPAETAEEPAAAEEQPQAEAGEPEPGEGTPAQDAPVEEPPSESSAEVEPDPETPSQAEGDETSDQASNQEESE
jgi:large subunit ribosomal protein L10